MLEPLAPTPRLGLNFQMRACGQHSAAQPPLPCHLTALLCAGKPRAGTPTVMLASQANYLGPLRTCVVCTVWLTPQHLDASLKRVLSGGHFSRGTPAFVRTLLALRPAQAAKLAGRCSAGIWLRGHN